MSHTETQTFLHRPAPGVVQAVPCFSPPVYRRMEAPSPGHTFYTRRWKDRPMPCKVRQARQTPATRHGRKEIPAPLGIRDGGLGGISPRQGVMIGIGVDVGGCSVPAEDSRRGTKRYVYMYLARLWCMPADVVGQSCAWPLRGGEELPWDRHGGAPTGRWVGVVYLVLVDGNGLRCRHCGNPSTCNLRE